MEPKRKAILLLVVSFLLGGICGAILSHELWKPAPPIRHQDFLLLLREKLELTPQQQSAVDSILCSSKDKIDVHKKAILALKDSIRVEIEELLTPEQKVRLEQLLKEIPGSEKKK